ncbi:unnamed protein product [Fusarium venenatum]|uniref:Uncharacterized protein n=1 Tax=Fusarium venenatum TaxID=56646 RepID=A0A2L2SYC9_9HYPO|nr:uncharacterized protein FVRRES_11174 [Fusarium venenatum]CEI38483.1 unnamed protein product [Fusarium venenatum]
MEMLDTAPDCLDPATRSAAESWMTSVPSPEQTILFALKPPYPTLSMISSQDIIFNNCFIRVESALRKRLNVIVQLVEVILFLRVANHAFKYVYLTVFDLIRDVDGNPEKEGAIQEIHELPWLDWWWLLSLFMRRLDEGDSADWAQSGSVAKEDDSVSQVPLKRL